MKKKKLKKTFAGLFRYYPNVAAHQNWEGLVYNFSVQKHYRFDITDIQTGRQTRTFLLKFQSPTGTKCAKKSFSSIGRKIIFVTVAIYVLRDSGHIENHSIVKYTQS